MEALVSSSRPKRLRIEVTQEDIDNGKAQSCGSCPIALALKRCGYSTPLVSCVVVPECGASYIHSPRSMRFMHRFDKGKPVKPATFVLRAYT